MPKDLACPNCGSTELSTVEDLIGAAHGHAVVNDDGEREFIHGGWTEVWWDSSTSVAVECRQCGWQQGSEHNGPNLDELTEVKEGFS